MKDFIARAIFSHVKDVTPRLRVTYQILNSLSEKLQNNRKLILTPTQKIYYRFNNGYNC